MNPILKAKCLALARANAVMRELAPKILDSLRPHIGNAVINANGFRASLDKELPDLCGGPGVATSLDYNHQTIVLAVRANATVDGKEEYQAADTCFLATTDGDAVTGIIL